MADETMSRLRYIANSPPQDHGGFQPEIVKAAEEAIAEIEALRSQVPTAEQRVVPVELLYRLKDIVDEEKSCPDDYELLGQLIGLIEGRLMP